MAKKGNKVSFKGVKGNEFEALPEGWYQAEIEKFKPETWDKNSSSWYEGMPLWNIQYSLLANLEGESEGIKNRKAFCRLTLDPEVKGSGFTRQHNDGLGIDEDFYPEEVANDFLGAKIWIRLNRKKNTEERALATGQTHDNNVVGWSNEEPIGFGGDEKKPAKGGAKRGRSRASI